LIALPAPPDKGWAGAFFDLEFDEPGGTELPSVVK